MSRDFDGGKNNYSKLHKTNKNQQTLHILSNELLLQYGADIDSYNELTSHINYTMGSVSTNARDTRLDNKILGVKNGEEYDRITLTQSTNRNKGLSNTQQINALNKRASLAKTAYQLTGDEAYRNIHNDIQNICKNNFNVDGRKYRNIK